MPFSAAGSLTAGSLTAESVWSLVLAFRRPTDDGRAVLPSAVTRGAFDPTA
jgi:hypothetical protein